MSALLPNIRLMPYAADTWSPASMTLARQANAGLEVACPFPCVALDMASRVPLRLNNSRFDLEGMPDLSETGGSEAHYVRELVKRQCRPWDTQAHRFVDRYFEVLEELLSAHADALNERLAPFSGLYDSAHFLFSAPRPFPRAHVFAPASVPASTLSAEDFVAVDFAFWIGRGLVAVLPAQSGLTPKKARERTERLERAGVRVATFGTNDLASGARDFFARALAPVLPSYWDGDPVPIGPFRSTSIED